MTVVYESSAFFLSRSGALRTLGLFGLIFLSHCVSGKAFSTTNDCVPPENVAVDFAWGYNRLSHVDDTAYMNETREDVMIKLFNQIDSVYHGSRFGVFHIGDVDRRFQCYQRLVGLTSNITLIENALNQRFQPTATEGICLDTSVESVYFAAVDETFKWRPHMSHTSDGAYVVRLIAISTDDIPIQTVKNTTSSDGTVPTESVEDVSFLQLRYTLRKKQVKLITLVYERKAYDVWNGLEDNMLNGHYLNQLNLGLDSATIIKQIADMVNDFLCPTTETEIDPASVVLSTANAESDSSSTAAIGAGTAAGALGLLVAVGAVVYKWAGASGLPTSATVSEVLESVNSGFEVEDREVYAGAGDQNFA